MSNLEDEKTAFSRVRSLVGCLENLSFVALLYARFILCYIFYNSAVLKLPKGVFGIGQGNWSSTLYLFEYEYKIPYLKPELAAYLGTYTELIAAILLFLGLGARLGATMILGTALLIYFSYEGSNVYETVYWSSLALVIITMGAGKLSIDSFIQKSFSNK